MPGASDSLRAQTGATDGSYATTKYSGSQLDNCESRQDVRVRSETVAAGVEKRQTRRKTGEKM